MQIKVVLFGTELLMNDDNKVVARFYVPSGSFHKIQQISVTDEQINKAISELNYIKERMKTY